MRASKSRPASPSGVPCLAVYFLGTTSHAGLLPTSLFPLLLAFSRDRAAAAAAAAPAPSPAPAPAAAAVAAAAGHGLNPC